METSIKYIESNQTLSELLIKMVSYTNPMIHVVDKDGIYIGTLNYRLLSVLDNSILESNMPIRDICDMLQKKGVELNISKNIMENTNNLWNTYKSGIEEIPLVDNFNHLDSVLTKEQFFARYIEVENDLNEPFIYSFHNLKLSNRNLNAYAYNINSQYGEDGILQEIFSRIGFTNKQAIEFGGWDGIYLSNIRNLIISNGFSGLFIEGDHEKAKEGMQNYCGWENVKFMEGYVGFKENRLLDSFLDEAGIDYEPDLLSIDIDGYDYHVWKYLEKYRPRVVIIEFNPTISNEVVFIPPEREDVFKGCSALALKILGIKKGYSLCCCTLTNCIFIRDEEYNKLGIKDNSLDALRPIEMCYFNRYIQSYDEHIYYTGLSMYHWSGKPFGSNEFIPK